MSFINHTFGHIIYFIFNIESMNCLKPLCKSNVSVENTIVILTNLSNLTLTLSNQILTL